MARFHNGMRPIHPGEILREEYLLPLRSFHRGIGEGIAHRGGTDGCDRTRRCRCVQRDRLRLARYFGGDAETWLNLQQAYDLKTVEQRVGDTIRAEVAPRNAKAA
ncbi:Virulence-associated protein I [Cupriavidus sp. H18C1]|uniref:transcriptional regulator n=1 Tax=Cupriavidus sp. H18C1 TaxID=3241601 RepID=UPI003BB96E45